jgi:hypothetical protein
VIQITPQLSQDWEQKHTAELTRAPSQWMSWNYQATLEQSGLSVDSG